MRGGDGAPRHGTARRTGRQARCCPARRSRTLTPTVGIGGSAATSARMSASAWDRAAALPSPSAHPPVAPRSALSDELPTAEAPLAFMRDAELRFTMPRMRRKARRDRAPRGDGRQRGRAAPPGRRRGPDVGAGQRDRHQPRGLGQRRRDRLRLRGARKAPDAPPAVLVRRSLGYGPHREHLGEECVETGAPARSRPSGDMPGKSGRTRPSGDRRQNSGSGGCRLGTAGPRLRPRLRPTWRAPSRHPGRPWRRRRLTPRWRPRSP